VRNPLRTCRLSKMIRGRTSGPEVIETPLIRR
jgi:hypothetical protein